MHHHLLPSPVRTLGIRPRPPPSSPVSVSLSLSHSHSPFCCPTPSCCRPFHRASDFAIPGLLMLDMKNIPSRQVITIMTYHFHHYHLTSTYPFTQPDPLSDEPLAYPHPSHT